MHLDIKLRLSLIELINKLIHRTFLEFTFVSRQFAFLPALERDFMETDHWSELDLVFVGPIDLSII